MKPDKTLYLALLCWLYFSPVWLVGQNVPQKMIDNLEKFASNRQTEKVYIHFDKPYYARKDDIWMKIYLVDAVSHVPVDKGIVHIDLIDNEGIVLKSLTVGIEDGTGKADFELTELNITPGTVTIRAYTQNMRNYDPEWFFKYSFEIGNPADKKPLSSVKNDVSMDFYPEGGELVLDKNNILAFKIWVNTDGGSEIKGQITGPDGKAVTDFSTSHQGMGKVKFRPAMKGNYYAEFTFNEKAYKFQLPEILNAGYTLNVINTGYSFIVHARHSDSTFMRDAFVVIHQRGKPYAVLTAAEDFTISKSVKIKDMEPGIATITLFDNFGLPRRERVAFAYDEETAKNEISITTDQAAYGKREKVSISLDHLQNLKNTVMASVSVTDLDIVPENSRKTHLLSYLLLSSDIKGEIKDPLRYFDEDNPDRKAQMDLLMLTQGWRRFTWSDVINKDLPVKSHQPETGFSIKGRLVNYYNRDKPVEGQVKITSLNDPLSTRTVMTDEDGNFEFPDLRYRDSTELVIQANKLHKKKKTVTDNDNIHIIVFGQKKDYPQVEKKSETGHYESAVKPLESYFEAFQNIVNIDSVFRLEQGVILLGEFEVQSTKESNMLNNPFRQAEVLYGEPSDRMVMDSLHRVTPSGNVLDILRGFPGIRVMGSFPMQEIRMRGTGSANSGVKPLVLIDGVYMSESFDSASVLNFVQITDIAYIDILRGPDAAIFGSQGANGVISIFTRTGPGKQNTGPRTGILNVKYPGLYAAREFYTPDHSEKSYSLAKPDYRTTLYWYPDINFREETSFEFFTSDDTGTYQVHLEGITSDGKVVNEDQVFVVK